MRKAVAAAGAVAMLAANAAEAADWANVVMYHRFGEPDHRSTNIRLEQFDAHLEELTSGGYAVLPLEEIVAAIRNGTELPDRAVAITIDDAYLSVYAEAWPRLRAAGLPFTIFVSTDAIDQRFPDFMNWDQLREMRDAGVTFGAHTAAHLHMPVHSRSKIEADLARARAQLKAELGLDPSLFAYPFGEASAAVQEVVAAAGYETAFGQHSGVLNDTADPLFLPRFPLSETFGDMERFRLVANALPIRITELTPANPLLTANPPLFGFTVVHELAHQDQLNCFATGQGRVHLEWIGPRVEVRLPEAFGPGRARINCTSPAGAGRWHWLGMQYYVQG